MRSATFCKVILAFLLLVLLSPVAGAVDVSRSIAVNPYGKIALAGDYTAYPVLNNSAVPPLVMLAVSRDEQLFIKAYTDYTDLDGDGVIDTTYNNNFAYSGYFDATLCYSYGGGVFKATATAANHLCSGVWSGNFLNWVSMSRADVLRFVLYGGNRSTDTTAATILERAYIPNDLHAWSKVYISTADVPVSRVTPYTNTTITLCNASFDSGTDKGGAGGVGDPYIRVAQGSFSEWAATASNQCSWAEDNTASTDEPSKSSAKLDELLARVQVCDSSASATIRESFCEAYVNGSATTYKPVGLLQRYGEGGQMRFGLITGSFVKPRSGGVLRRNIGRIAGNDSTTDCATGDEISLKDGHFCLTTASGTEGVINSLNALKLTQWNGNNDWNDCNTYGILNRQGSIDSKGVGVGDRLNDPGLPGNGSQNCSAWGNPMSEIYAEALRYISADAGGATGIFNGTGDLAGLPAATWKDPYAISANPYCAACSIIVLSTGLNAFDSDEIPSQSALGSDANKLTDSVGTLEKISGNYIFGRSGATPVGATIPTYSDICTSKVVPALSSVRGICPDIPSMEGSYLIAGLAFGARTTDMRPGLTTPSGDPRPQVCDASGGNCVAYKNTIKTYAVALSENLPKFQVALSSTTSITMVPLCQANNTGTAKITEGGWRTCYLGSVGIGPKTSQVDSRFVYGRPLVNTTSGSTAGSFSLVWEDSLWGNDHDNDVVSMITYCVGDECKRSSNLPLPGAVIPGLCFYSDTKFGGTPTCPTTISGTLNSSMSSIKVPSGYTVTLADSFGNTVSFKADNNNLTTVPRISLLGVTLGTWNDAAVSFTIAGGTFPTYTGYDICWLSTATICTAANGQPSVGANEVLVRDETLSAFAGNAMLTGYSTAGSNNDGAQRLVLRPGNSDNSILTNVAVAPTNWDPPSVVKYTASGTSAKQLENPLFYAAKYGGFEDARDSKGALIQRPCDPPECAVSNWDSVNNTTGAAGSDGIPDTYFPVRNPAQLSDRLAAVFNTILARAGSGTAAAVVANSASGEGVTYSALYQAKVQNKAASQTVGWAGNVYALWTDTDGLLRSGGNFVSGVQTLGSYTQNPIVVFCTDTSGSSRFTTYTDPTQVPTAINATSCTGSAVTDLKTIWSAQDELSNSTISATTSSTQRTYTAKATATSGRYIFTWIDANHDGKVDAGEQDDFAWASTGFTGPTDLSKRSCGTNTLSTSLTFNYRFLNTCDPQEAMNLVNWLRGQDSGFKNAAGTVEDIKWRSRTITETGGATAVSTTYRLGDIVNSTPLAVSTPAEAFDQLYNDASYGRFRAAYQTRRQMVYVGANDGMIHAFNGGFYDAANKQINLQPKTCTASGCVANTSFVGHDLGAEIWAYVPGNLLPHIRWLADPAYAHNFYVDGSPTAQDIKAFAADTSCAQPSATQCHPDGWGTILIVPFRFGGGPLDVVTNSKTANDFQNSYPAFVVLDVTNPEAPPVLLAELTNTQVKASANQAAPACAAGTSAFTCANIANVISTYTSSTPALAMFRAARVTNPAPSKFYLMTGSGSTDNGGINSTQPGAGGNAVSSAPLTIRAYDATDLVSNTVSPTSYDFSTLAGTRGLSSYAGDLIASDQDLDGLAETLYFGSTGGTTGGTGSLWALDLGEVATPGTWSRRELLTDVARPIVVRPTIGVNALGQTQVFMGTGRAFTKNDLADKSQQYILSVVDKQTTTPGWTAAMSQLKDVTSVNVTPEGIVSGVNDSSGNPITDELALANDILKNYRGWKVLLDTKSGNTAIPSERVVSAQTLFSGVLLTTTYLPGTDSCTDQGTGRLYAMNYSTGAAGKGLASLLGVVVNGSTTTMNHYVSLGKGMPSAPSLHRGGEPKNSLRACIQSSSGAVLCADVTPLSNSNSSEVSWREPIDK